MKIRLTYKILGICLLLVSAASCIEEIDFATEDFESALVVEATISNELKQQEILLSRTYKFESNGPNPEQNATVRIESSAGAISFREVEPGKYVSLFPFGAQRDIDYRIKIITNDGRSYSSTPERLTTSTEIGELYIERETDDSGNDGVSILVDSYDSDGTSKYYRFEYEESYKIIAPKWRDQDLIVIDPEWSAGQGCVVQLVPKTDERRICYASDTSNVLILGSTLSLTEDRLSRFPVRRILAENPIISYRYSILVKQFIQSREAFNYFETLQQFSESESVFSENQPGFFNGNVQSDLNIEEKVVGFFDVTYVSKKRVYLNYEDLFANESRPPYFTPCFESTPVRDQGHPTDRCGGLISSLLSKEIAYWMENPLPESDNMGPYIMVPIACGDCTELGANVAPDFWEE